MRESIIFKPKDVEELTSILQMMENIPQDLSSFQDTIDDCLKTYDILEVYSYKFSNRKELDKRWEIFGAPKDLLELCERRKDELE